MAIDSAFTEAVLNQRRPIEGHLSVRPPGSSSMVVDSDSEMLCSLQDKNRRRLLVQPQNQQATSALPQFQVVPATF